MNELTARGISILFISSDYPELLAMSDRVAVVRDGRILHIAEAQRLSEYQLLAIASGADPGEELQKYLRLREVTLPYLRALRDRLNETVHLAALDEQEMSALYLHKLGTEKPTPMISRAGARVPLCCTAVGKALLAFDPPQKVETWIREHGLTRYTDATITDPDAFMAELANIRQTGFGLDREEHEEGIRCIAAPIYDASGKVVAAVSVAGPSDRMPDDLAQSPMRTEVVNTAMIISHALGYGETRPEVHTVEG